MIIISQKTEHTLIFIVALVAIVAILSMTFGSFQPSTNDIAGEAIQGYLRGIPEIEGESTNERRAADIEVNEVSIDPDRGSESDSEEQVIKSIYLANSKPQLLLPQIDYDLRLRITDQVPNIPDREVELQVSPNTQIRVTPQLRVSDDDVLDMDVLVLDGTDQFRQPLRASGNVVSGDDILVFDVSDVQLLVGGSTTPYTSGMRVEASPDQQLFDVTFEVHLE